MTMLECNRCGTEFDTEREPVTPGQNTNRCPSCGEDHTDQLEQRPQPVIADGGAEGVTITIEIRVHGAEGVSINQQ